MKELKSPCAFGRLLEIMAILRSPGGCPWDAAQTPDSLRRYLLEEAYEFLEALDGGDPAAIRDELGDLLLQVVFHARIFEERVAFNMADVATAIAEKLVRRHPHVFDPDTQTEPAALDLQWERIKTEERRGRGNASPHTTIPAALPALSRARKVAEKSRIAEDEAPPPELHRLLTRFEDAVQAEAAEKVEESLGELLFALVRSAAGAQVDAEESLRRAVDRRLIPASKDVPAGRK